MFKRIYFILGLVFLVITSAHAGSETKDPDEPESKLASICRKYRAGLPKIDLRGDLKSPEQKATAIVQFLNKFRPPTLQLQGEDQLIQKVKGFIELDKPLQFLLPSFPFKSKNTEKKVIGPDPDLGELLGLTTLEHVCRQISELYSPGAKVTLVTDGVYCAEPIGVSEMEATMYVDQIKTLIKALDAPIEILSLADFEESPTYHKSFEEILKILDGYNLTQLGVSYNPTILRDFALKEIGCTYYHTLAKARALRLVKTQKNFKGLFEEFKKTLQDLDYDQVLIRLEEKNRDEKDLELQRVFLSIKNALDQAHNKIYKDLLKEIPEVISRRTKQFGCYLSSIINEDQVIRLSNYMQHPDMSLKLPFCLIYGDGVPGTPWHHTPIVHEVGNTQVRIHMRTRQELGLELQEESMEGVSFPIRWMHKI